MSGKWKGRYLPRSAEVYSLYLSEKARGAIGKATRSKSGDEIWQLILQAIDAGFVTQNNYAVRHGELRLRILFPGGMRGYRGGNKQEYLSRYNLLVPRDLEHIQSAIFPVALQNRDAVIADPSCLSALVGDFVKSPAPFQNRPLKDHSSSNQQSTQLPADQPASLPPWGMIDERQPVRIVAKEEETETTTETVTKTITKTKTKSKSIEIEWPCVMYGVQLWPKSQNWQNYTYRQCRAAQWIFMDLLSLVQGSTLYPSPSTKAREIRFSTRGYGGASVDRAVISLVHAIAGMMEQDPSATCFPIIPLPHSGGF